MLIDTLCLKKLDFLQPWFYLDLFWSEQLCAKLELTEIYFDKDKLVLVPILNKMGCVQSFTTLNLRCSGLPIGQEFDRDKKILLGADYGCVLWQAGIGTSIDELISDDLQKRLDAWEDAYWDRLDNPDFNWKVFVREGELMRQELQNELGDKWAVAYAHLDSQPKIKIPDYVRGFYF
jgi:hypothetical protein